jgi:hypothetical protein
VGRSGILGLFGTDALTPAEKSKPVTPEEAKRVWASIPNPSARRVAKALTQEGRRVHHSTVARWRAEEWRPVAHSLHPLEAVALYDDLKGGRDYVLLVRLTN